MNDLERATGMALARFGAAMGVEVGPDRARIYHRVFEDAGLTPSQVAKAAMALVRDHRYPSIPPPAAWIAAAGADTRALMPPSSCMDYDAGWCEQAAALIQDGHRIRWPMIGDRRTAPERVGGEA